MTVWFCSTCLSPAGNRPTTPPPSRAPSSRSARRCQLFRTPKPGCACFAGRTNDSARRPDRRRTACRCDRASADPTLSLDGLHAFFEPARRATSCTRRPRPQQEEREEIGDLFNEPVHHVPPEMRVVARKEDGAGDPPPSLALDDLHDLYAEPVEQHRAELEHAIADLYEQSPADHHARTSRNRWATSTMRRQSSITSTGTSLSP